MRTAHYDVIVIGAGHAGCEAAHACARMGLKTALVTMNLDLIAQMSCNPAIGGIAKGHLVREVDALGGIMGLVADAVGIQFRLLNTSRGPAVWSPRAQMDKKQYRVRMRQTLESVENLRILQAEVAEIEYEPLEDGRRRVRGVKFADGRRYGAEAVVVTTGTFLNGLAHVGETKYQCGRSGEPPSTATPGAAAAGGGSATAEPGATVSPTPTPPAGTPVPVNPAVPPATATPAPVLPGTPSPTATPSSGPAPTNPAGPPPTATPTAPSTPRPVPTDPGTPTATPTPAPMPTSPPGATPTPSPNPGLAPGVGGAPGASAGAGG